MRITLLLGLLGLVACAPTVPNSVTKGSSSLDVLPNVSAPMMAFAAAPGISVLRPNQQIAQDFIDLEFHMESGLALPDLTRFEGPISIAMTGGVPPSAQHDLTLLIARLRAEAGIDIRQAASGSAATITIEFLPKAVLRRLEPTAACFVVPNVSSMAEYRGKRGSRALDWQLLTRRDRAAIFIPSDTSPQEVRDCLHEETAQSMGPLNDLYRLPDSVFNDDNFQSVLTEFDMLMLKMHYAPELTTGMGEADVLARVPALVARLNPKGQYPGGWMSADTPRAWIDAVGTALGPNAPQATRLPAARRMLSIAQSQGWQDNRLGFAWFALGRLEAPTDPIAAEASYSNAARIYASLPDDGVHLSHALMQLSAIALASGHADAALKLADQALPLAMVGQNAALLATLMLIKSECLAIQGHPAEAEALRLDSLPAARYAFGSQQEVQARASEIAALAKRGQRG
ncbi:MAG: DUF2927 domain-containing protein [Paracoccaceae bacterium]